MSSQVEFQRTVTALALDSIAGFGFALAGAGAIREHGLLSRPTQDIDLFTTSADAATFHEAVQQVTDALTTHGYAWRMIMETYGFARISLTADAGTLEIDLGIDWRAHPPAQLHVGPVLNLEDAIGNKVAALYSRSEVRDYLDVDTIRQAGLFTDHRLIQLAQERDPGFELAHFITALRAADTIAVTRVATYGVTEPALTGLTARFTAWADSLTND